MVTEFGRGAVMSGLGLGVDETLMLRRGVSDILERSKLKLATMTASNVICHIGGRPSGVVAGPSLVVR